MLRYGNTVYHINVAFYKKTPQPQQSIHEDTPPTIVTEEPTTVMDLFAWLSKKYHSDMLKDSNDVPIIHCAIIMKSMSGDGTVNDTKEYAYDYLSSGARKLENRYWHKTHSEGWDDFISIPVTKDQYERCHSFLEKEVSWCDDNMSSKYDAYHWELGLPLMDPKKIMIPLGPIRFVPFFGSCVPGETTSYTCSSFVCVALQKARIPELMEFKPWKTTSHMIWFVLKDHYPNAGPHTVKGLKI